ncbi:MAG: trimethylamine methyltransferase family protein [Armatimonadota bacterium]
MKPHFFEVLSKDEIRKIDSESKRILEDCGVRIRHEECLGLLENIGCKVDQSNHIVRIPSSIVDKAVGACPEVFSLYGRDSQWKIDLGGENVYFGPGGFAVFAEDLDSMETLSPTPPSS